MAFNQGICVKIHQTKSNQNGRQSGGGANLYKNPPNQIKPIWPPIRYSKQS